MAVMTFAAIDIGSYEVSMKIFELSKRIGFRELNDVRYSLELGKAPMPIAESTRKCWMFSVRSLMISRD